MRKIILLLLFKGLCFYTMPVVEAQESQEARSSLEVLGGVGISDLTSNFQTQFLETLGGFINDQIETRESAFSPGLYASAEFRWIGHFDRFRFGLFIPISQYSAVFNSTTERESPGWTHKNSIGFLSHQPVGFATQSGNAEKLAFFDLQTGNFLVVLDLEKIGVDADHFINSANTYDNGKKLVVSTLEGRVVSFDWPF